MHRRTFVATIAASGVTLAVPPLATAQTDAGTPAATEETTMTDTGPQTGYADINGLQMYYEIHGEGGVPLVLLHGGISTIEVDFAGILPGLAETRQVIGIEQQGHGHTGDIDRPLSTAQMADDTAALLQELGVEQADFVGYSVGAGIAMELAIRYPELVRKLVFMTLIIDESGYHPGHLEGMAMMQPEMLTGSPFAEAYAEVAPNPDDWPALIEKIKTFAAAAEGWSAEDIEAIAAPALIIAGDSDIVRPEHAVEVFRMFGGGVPGDMVGLPASRLAILPGTTHITLVQRPEWLLPMITEFLDAPLAEGE
jgi:pimeloyl-ACP methyl ester carboxylesterase